MQLDCMHYILGIAVVDTTNGNIAFGKHRAYPDQPPGRFLGQRYIISSRYVQGNRRRQMLKQQTNLLFTMIRWIGFPRYWPFVSGIHRSPVDSTHKGPVMQSDDVLFDASINKLFDKQSNCREFWTPWRSCNPTAMYPIITSSGN